MSISKTKQDIVFSRASGKSRWLGKVLATIMILLHVAPPSQQRTPTSVADLYWDACRKARENNDPMAKVANAAYWELNKDRKGNLVCRSSALNGTKSYNLRQVLKEAGIPYKWKGGSRRKDPVVISVNGEHAVQLAKSIRNIRLNDLKELRFRTYSA